MATACGPDEPARLPWWPATPAVAARSPLLDAVGLAPPRLDGPGCQAGGPSARSGLRGVLLRLAGGMEVTCVAPTVAAPGAEPYVALTFDGRGRAESAEWLSAALAPARAAAVADSVVRRGLGRPGARPLTCPMEGWPYGVLQPGGGGVVPEVRGWRTPDYDALVLAYPTGSDPAGRAVVHLRAFRHGFIGCRAGGGAARSPGAA
jgi:hypothetical protein